MSVAALERLVGETTAALAARVDGRGVLADADGPTPTDHYASTFLALALAVRDEPGDADLARALVEAWRAAEPRGHVPFNRLALALLADVAPDLVDSETWDRWRAACPLRDDDPSNNWRLLSAACRVVEGGEAAPFDALLSRWLTPAGGFVDGPLEPGRVPVPGGAPHAWRGSTPIAYHAKAAMLAALVARAAPSSERAARLAAMRAWLAAFSDAGLLGAFGRSTTSLFGDACAQFVWLDAIARGGPDAPDAAARLEASVQRLSAARRDDGLLPLTPCGARGEAGGWDPYMHLSVYGAYHVGLVAWALRRWGEGLAEVAPRLAAPSLHDEDAGLLAVRTREHCALVATRGQPVQSYVEGAVDLRYAACRVFHRRSGARVSTASAVRAPPDDVVERPELAAGVPVFERADRLYGAVEAVGAPHVSVHDGAFVVVAACVPQGLSPVPPARWSLGWWLDNLDHHLAGGRRRRARALSAATLDDVRVVTVLAADLRAGRLARAWWIDAPDDVTWLDACATAGSGEPTAARAARVAPDPEPVALGAPVPVPTADADGWGRCAEPIDGPRGLWRLDECDDGEPGAAWLAVRVDGDRLVVATPWTTLAVGRDGRPADATG